MASLPVSTQARQYLKVNHASGEVKDQMKHTNKAIIESNMESQALLLREFGIIAINRPDFKRYRSENEMLERR